MYLTILLFLCKLQKSKRFFISTGQIFPIELSHLFKPLFGKELRRSSVVNATSYTTPTMSSSNRFFVSGESQDAYSCLPMCCLSDSDSQSLQGIRRMYTKKSILVIFRVVFIAPCFPPWSEVYSNGVSLLEKNQILIKNFNNFVNTQLNIMKIEL